MLLTEARANAAPLQKDDRNQSMSDCCQAYDEIGKSKDLDAETGYPHLPQQHGCFPAVVMNVSGLRKGLSRPYNRPVIIDTALDRRPNQQNAEQEDGTTKPSRRAGSVCHSLVGHLCAILLAHHSDPIPNFRHL